MTHPTMNTETQVAPDVATQNPTSDDIAPQTQDVANPETSADGTHNDTARPDEATDADKSVKRLQRRIDRVTAARYQAEAEARQLRERIAQYEQRQTQPQEGQQDAHLDPARFDELVSTRASEIAKVNEVAAKSNRTFEAGVKAHGEAFRESIATVIDEAGPLINQRGMPTPLGEAILDSDAPDTLLHYLGQNPDVAASLEGLSAAQLGRRIARIEGEMTAKPVSKVPRALTPVTPMGTSASKAESQMTDAEWYAARKRNKS
jgi:hypothetical protein